MGCSQSKSTNNAVVVEQPKAQAVAAESAPPVASIKQDEKPMVSALPEANSTVPEGPSDEALNQSGEKGVPNNVDPSTAKEDEETTYKSAEDVTNTLETAEEKSDVVQEEMKAGTASPDETEAPSPLDDDGSAVAVEDSTTAVDPSPAAVETAVETNSTDGEVKAVPETTKEPHVEDKVASTTEAEESGSPACKTAKSEKESETSGFGDTTPNGAISGPSSTIGEGSGGTESNAIAEHEDHATISGVENAHEKLDEETATPTTEQVKASAAPEGERRANIASEASDDNPITNEPNNNSGITSDTKINDVGGESEPIHDTVANETATHHEEVTINLTDNAPNATVSSTELKASSPQDESQGAIVSADAATTNEAHNETTPPIIETSGDRVDEEEEEDEEIAGESKDDATAKEEMPLKAPTCEVATTALEQPFATCTSSEPSDDVATPEDADTKKVMVKEETAEPAMDEVVENSTTHAIESPLQAAAAPVTPTVVNQLAEEVVERTGEVESPAVTAAVEKECKLKSDDTHEALIDKDEADEREPVANMDVGVKEEEESTLTEPKASTLLVIPKEKEGANSQQNSVAELEASTIDVADQTEPSPVEDATDKLVPRQVQEVTDKPETSVVKEEAEKSESSASKHGRDKSELVYEEASTSVEPEKSPAPTLIATKEVEEEDQKDEEKVDHLTETSHHLAGSEICHSESDMSESQVEEDRELPISSSSESRTIPSTYEEKNEVNAKAPESAEGQGEESKMHLDEEQSTCLPTSKEKGANVISTSADAVYAAGEEARENVTSNATTKTNDDVQKAESMVVGDLEYSESQEPSSVYDDEPTETTPEEEEEEEPTDDEPILELKNVTAMTRVLIPEDQRNHSAPKPSRWGWPTGLGLSSGTNTTGISSDSVASKEPQKEKPQMPDDKDRSAPETGSSETRWGLKTGLLSFKNSTDAVATGEGDHGQPMLDGKSNPAEMMIATNEPSAAKSTTPARDITATAATAAPAVASSLPVEKPKASEPPKKKELTDIEKARLYAASVLLESENVIEKEEEAPRRGFGSWLSR